jgi:hypothetical protein
MALSARQQIAFVFKKPLGRNGFMLVIILWHLPLHWRPQLAWDDFVDFPNISKKFARALAQST